MFNDNVVYSSTHERGNLKGFLAYEGKEQVEQCLIIFSDGFGLRDYFKELACQFVGEGIAVFCADMFEDQKSFKTYGEAINTLNFLTKHNDVFRARSLAALHFVRDYFGIDTKKITTMGYCFGAAAALEVMRGGYELKGIITLHGKLVLNSRVSSKTDRPRIISFHGDQDPFITPDEVEVFKQEMGSVNADLTFITYSNTAHNFTNPGAGNHISSGSAYNEKAKRRSYEYIKSFLRDQII